ncbi:pimeloyl-CoA dehydrogenase small subunit [Alsobacter metallidurans]|uniref:Pimeloyl-CoA dehydrogenase small subunit n=1 Tax=Alsobacter metallidurans TaxID=340221 RepID=A0A917MJC3_9HYPH|nr:acyl-CoA dehydrogenase family protein [Alsobacter metallidurans]GGH30936.1 pimeloyl-CoA dehydrogenase small subunit [Alsobacter metallidurans]
MDFDLTEEQRLLKDSVDRLLADAYGFDARKRIVASEGGVSPAVWAQFAELGLLGLPFSEEQGGFGGGPVETMLVMEAFGRALVVEPYLATVILGGGLIRHAGSAAQQAAILPAVAAGERRLAFAHAERQARYDLFDVATTARPDGEGWVLDGQKGLVLHGDGADTLIVSARTAGATRDLTGLGLFLVDASAPGVSRRGYPTQDGQRAAEVTLTGVRVGPDAVLGDPKGALPAIERVVDEAIAALCAEAVGAMEASLQSTVEYLKTRQQFGTPIGAFQVLQHRSAEMVVALEQARSMAMLAAMMATAPDARERRAAVSGAKAQIGRSARFIGQQSVQLHGGVGVTMEYQIGHYFKRLTMIDTLFGDADHHLGLTADAGGLINS